jgi:membrane-associated phospholipid phosphatase
LTIEPLGDAWHAPHGRPAALDADETVTPQVGALVSADERLLRLARTVGHTSAAERAAARFSRLGEHAGVWLAIGAAGATLDGRRRAQWRRAAATVGVVYALNTAIKPLVRRPRPVIAGLPPLTGTPTRLSFPSAHASTSFAGALSYSRLGLPAAPLYALALAMSYSRLYLGVHYPSDVLAGALLGVGVARLRACGSGPPAALGERSCSPVGRERAAPASGGGSVLPAGSGGS